MWIQIGVTVRKHSIRVKIGDFFVPCNLEIWWKTLKNNRAPLLYCIKLCASFRSHRWIPTWVTVGNTQFTSKSAILCPVWPWNLTDDLEKQYGTFSVLLQDWCIISEPSVNLNFSYSPETAKLGFDLYDLDLWPLTFTVCMDITFVNGNNSRKFHDDKMTGTLWKRCNRRTDGQTDGLKYS